MRSDGLLALHSSHSFQRGPYRHDGYGKFDVRGSASGFCCNQLLFEDLSDFAFPDINRCAPTQNFQSAAYCVTKIQRFPTFSRDGAYNFTNTFGFVNRFVSLGAATAFTCFFCDMGTRILKVYKEIRVYIHHKGLNLPCKRNCKTRATTIAGISANPSVIQTIFPCLAKPLSSMICSASTLLPIRSFTS
jgi:hypothetical protein